MMCGKMEKKLDLSADTVIYGRQTVLMSYFLFINCIRAMKCYNCVCAKEIPVLHAANLIKCKAILANLWQTL